MKTNRQCPKFNQNSVDEAIPMKGMKKKKGTGVGGNDGKKKALSKRDRDEFGGRKRGRETASEEEYVEEDDDDDNSGKRARIGRRGGDPMVRLASYLQGVYSIIQRLPQSSVFQLPARKSASNYDSIVPPDKQMDLGIIRTKIEKQQYSSREEFLHGMHTTRHHIKSTLTLFILSVLWCGSRFGDNGNGICIV
jgi:hypothetical protein